MQISTDTKVVISNMVLTQEVRGEIVLLDLSREYYFGLDAVGTRVWQLLGEGKVPKEVITVMLEEYDVSEEQLESDVFGLLGRLCEAGLITLEAS
jgi:hypothetical protein